MLKKYLNSPSVLAVIRIYCDTPFHWKVTVRAFEVNALDYLLKPVSRKRFGMTMDRILRPNSAEEEHNEKHQCDDVMVLIPPAE